ncbi:hypothetical protein [Clostridium thailandense]
MGKEFSDKVGEKLQELELKLAPEQKEDFLNEIYNIIISHLKGNLL